DAAPFVIRWARATWIRSRLSIPSNCPSIQSKTGSSFLLRNGRSAATASLIILCCFSASETVCRPQWYREACLSTRRNDCKRRPAASSVCGRDNVSAACDLYRFLRPRPGPWSRGTLERESPPFDFPPPDRPHVADAPGDLSPPAFCRG